MSLPPERRRQLQELGLRALVKRRFGAEVAASARPTAPGGGAGLVADRGDGGRLAAVFADSPVGLTAAVDVAHREGASELFFFAERNTPEVARRASQFALDVSVIDPDGDFATLAPAPAPFGEAMPSELEPLARRFAAAALDPVWEHGVLTGEWLGLEVARATLEEGLVTYDVGVGSHDREGNRLLYPDGPTDELLAHAVATVAAIRRPGLQPHPANQLVAERWLRTVLRHHPGLVGMDELIPGEAPEARTDLRQRGVAPAWGRRADGRPVVVVCSVGIDPDVVAQAADARLLAPGWPGAPADRPDGWDLVVAVPEHDDHPLTRRAAQLLRLPAEVVTVPPDWRSLEA